MAKANSGSGRGSRRPLRQGRVATPKKKTAAKKPAPVTAEPPLPAGPLRVGTAEGATPGVWIDRWQERMPGIRVELVPVALADQEHALATSAVDVAIVRLPIDRAGLHVIALYDEAPVVVCASDSHLTAADDLLLADLRGEVVISPRDPVLAPDVPGAVAPAFAPPATAEDAIALVATGVGVMIVPMSLARLHHRKDTAWRLLTDGPVAPVALAWRSDADSPLVDAFVGIVRGRTANSSR